MTSQGDQNNPLTSEHERRLRVMALNEMAVGFAKGPIEYLWRFYMALFSIRPKGRINYYYVESLMVFKEPGLRLSLFHEYIIAKIRSIEPQDKKVFYLLLERTAGQLNRQRKREEHIPEQMEEMVAEIDKMIDDEEAKDEETLSHAPDRQMEDTMFNPRRGWSRTSTSNIRSRNTDENLYDRPGIFTAAANLASTSSESSSGNFLLAEDWFEILDRPQRAPDDVLIAEIVFRPPPERLAGENPERPDASTSVLSNTAPGTSVINQSIVDFHLSSRPPNSSPVSLATPKAFSRSTTSFESSRKPSPAQRPNPGRRHLHPVSPSLDASSRFSRSVPADIHKATGLRKTQTSSPLSISSLPPRPRPPRRSSSLDDTSATQQAPVKQASSIHTSPHKHLSTYKQSSPNTPRHFLDVPPLKETSNLHHLGSANSSESFLPVLSSPVPPARSLASPDDEDTLSSLHLPSPVSDINVEGPDADADPLEDLSDGQGRSFVDEDVEEEEDAEEDEVEELDEPEVVIDGEGVDLDPVDKIDVGEEIEPELNVQDEIVTEPRENNVSLDDCSLVSEALGVQAHDENDPPHPSYDNSRLDRVTTNTSGTSGTGTARSHYTFTESLRNALRPGRQDSLDLHYNSLGAPEGRKYIYLYELVSLADRLHKAKSLYRIFTRNCYWFVGMIFHVLRTFTKVPEAFLVDVEGKRISLGPSDDLHRWMNAGHMGTFLNWITVVKAPRIFTIQAVIRKWHGASAKFRHSARHHHSSNCITINTDVCLLRLRCFITRTDRK
ncbi:hypothetical protein AN958_05943 [Leucoagaricus sp. SymC.cos]|nr:hypothetical protein AN958_05943 [Leucoagaricus sp. SymC.cos]